MIHSEHVANGQVLEGQYDITFVILSIVLVCIASITSLSLLVRLKNKSFINKSLWIIAASIALSFGIWSMHYMGMIAYATQIEVTYDILYTVLSMIPIICMSLLAIYILTLERRTRFSSITASVSVSVGVVFMHLMGMQSVVEEISHSYAIWSLIIAILMPYIAFRLLTIFYKFLSKWFCLVLFGLLLGGSVAISHYIIMDGVKMYVPQHVPLNNQFISFEHADLVASLLTFSVGLIVALLVIWIIMDYLLTKRVEKIDTVTRLANAQQLFLDMQKHSFKQMALWVFADFEYINKTYGYHYGDSYIKNIAQRISYYSSQSIHIYRTGESSILLATTNTAETFRELQEKLGSHLAKPLSVFEGLPIEPKAICAFSTSGNTSQDLLKEVTSITRMPQLSYDFAVVCYDATLHSFNVQDQIILGIDEAMVKDELFLAYQPKLYAKSNELAGVEALLRWHHHEYGFISPAVFVPLLEQIGKMDVVTDWVIEKVCQQITDWKRRGIVVGKVAINIPGDYLISDSLKQCLLRMTELYDVEPQDIELELTETSFVQNLELAMRAVQHYNELGYGVALDDFGTGLSSMSYLRQMQITTLKVDKAFIDHVPNYQKDVAIATTIMALGEALEIDVVVEGVETKEQLEFVLQTCKNPIVQGYYFSKPLFVYDLEAFLEKRVMIVN